MNLDELKEYNKLVIEASREVARPWKWATVILAGLFAGMISLYFFCPMTIDIDQDADLYQSDNNILNNR